MNALSVLFKTISHFGATLQIGPFDCPVPHDYFCGSIVTATRSVTVIRSSLDDVVLDLARLWKEGHRDAKPLAEVARRPVIS